MKDLPQGQQENIIQNFIRSLSPEETRAIGITNVNEIAIGQHIKLDMLNELLESKQIGGENIIAHAATLDGVQDASVGPIEAGSEGTPDMLAEPTPSLPQAVVPENVAELTTAERTSLWEQLSDANKTTYVAEAVPRQIGADMSELFVKGPFEEWPKEWVSLRGRSAEEFLAQTEKTDPRALLPQGTERVPIGYEWSVVSKIQHYIEERGLNPEHGIAPRQHETLEDFLNRALSERILRDGPLPWLKYSK
jgi:hypothetical protein